MTSFWTIENSAGKRVLNHAAAGVCVIGSQGDYDKKELQQSSLEWTMGVAMVLAVFFDRGKNGYNEVHE